MNTIHEICKDYRREGCSAGQFTDWHQQKQWM